MDFTNIIYSFKDIPEKRQYILDRTKRIYPDTDLKVLTGILDSIKIMFRKQDEKGASNHKKRTVYVSLNEIKKYNIKSKEDFFKYLNDPKSVITHETTHIFQNICKAFPDIKYIEEDKSGDYEICYESYISDPGEIQSRIEQILELIKWGFDKEEIVQFLFNRQHKDKDLWRDLVEQAKVIKKECSSKMPEIDENEDTTNDQGRVSEDWKTKTDDKNYVRSYL